MPDLIDKIRMQNEQPKIIVFGKQFQSNNPEKHFYEHCLSIWINRQCYTRITADVVHLRKIWRLNRASMWC